ncbi:hypothetical protein [Sporisorium scitamineum]|uniref:Acetyl-coenzyme A carboxylase carboxyl transferase subunit beta domain-containing protein n=1 Tax=Sporisorium scitamineum TaxID=49012 RepID=A0A0F7S0N1_9BASI|nr:hypothetical protein [Sporisorium scitamineum]
MEYVIRADAACTDGVVHKVAVKQGGVVNASDVLFVMDTSHKQDASTGSSSPTATVNPTEDPSIARPELQELQTRRHFLADAGRATSVAKRHARGYRTVRENLSMLLDPDSFLEYGDLALAAQKQRYTPTDLISKTGGDGIVTCFGRVDGHTIGLIMGDYMVLAGTQGPGDTDYPVGSGLQTPSFALMGQVRARGIPVVGVANGYVFAGNAALLGMCDVVVATRGGNSKLAGGGKGTMGKTSIGMGGKAMIEAGGLGVVESDDIGPTNVHAETGGVDIVVEHEDSAALMPSSPTTQPSPLGGAIDINAALKATRLLKLLTRTRATHLISLCDTPGFMVGPEFERTSTAGGSFRTFGEWFTAVAEFTQSGGRVAGLPAGSLGPMSLEGAVQLSTKKQLAKIESEQERKEVAEKAVEELYKGGRAINVAASMAEIDTVLDPAETREWLGKVVGDVLGTRRAMFRVRRDREGGSRL